MQLAYVKLVKSAKAVRSRAACSYEDIEALINNLVLFSTFSFAFSSGLVSSVWSHEDLLEADARAAEIMWGGIMDEEVQPFSIIFLRNGYER